VPYLNGLHNPTFQQDNARSDTASVTRQSFDCIQVTLLPWSSDSPDLSPIEHVWDMIGVNIGNLQHPPNTLMELRPRIQEIWDEIPQTDIDNVIFSMPRRVAECFRNRGSLTHY
jgi:hypothetical protein